MNRTTTLYIVRHGQTEWNVHHRMQGHQDSPLTELGKKQAQWLGEALRSDHLDVIYSSSSPRAYHTADLIREDRKIAIHERDDLKEINLGIWEGRTQDEVKATFAEQFDHFWHNPADFQVENSETFEQVKERAISLLNEILRRHEGQSILIVTHTVVVKLLMAYFENRPLQHIWNLPFIYPACLCKVEILGQQPHIILHGDVGHYQEEPIEG